MFKIFNYYRYSMENFYKFDGRACRMEIISFWIVYTLTLAIATVLSLLYGAINQGRQENFLTFWLTIFAVTILIHIVPYISLCTRRLHDINISGWLQIIYFMPFGNFILFIILYFIPGTNGNNQYGLKSKIF